MKQQHVPNPDAQVPTLSPLLSEHCELDKHTPEIN
jgi:hypothetical protein